MRDAIDEIESRGARLVVVGNGAPHQAKAFAEQESITFTLWVDEKMRAYEAAGLKRGVGALFGRRSAGHMARALKAGFRQTRTKGDPWQNGGAFVITTDGRTLFSQVSRESGDHAELSKIVAALDGAA